MAGRRTSTPASEGTPPAPAVAASADEAPARPTVGRLVHYRLSEGNVDGVIFRRGQWVTHQRTGRGTVAPVSLVRGNLPRAGDILPMLVVRVHEDGTVNGQVFLDGEDVLWVTSRAAGDEPGTWCWPERL